MRFFHIALHLLPFSLTALCVVWIAAQSPFAAPLVQKTSAEIEASISAAMAREVNESWLVPRLEAAVQAKDLVQIELYVDLAIEYRIAVPADLKDAALRVVDARSGVVAGALSCGACATNIERCETLAQIGVCAVPFEPVSYTHLTLPTKRIV